MEVETTGVIYDRSVLPDGTDLQNGRYKICTTLGKGGFGTTYKAWDYSLERFVAIKEFFPDGFAYRDAYQSREVQCIQDAQTFRQGKRRSWKEAQTLAKLDFSHIVRVYDSFEENNTAYIVMEYIDGETLSRYVGRNGPITASYLRELVLPLLRDLAAVHKNGLIHRDISPDNIMVTAQNGQLKLIDFGTAKDLTPADEKSRSHSMSQAVVRMNYSPLELFSSVEKHPSSDVYSLCATMYFCLTGEEPPSALDRAFDDTLKMPSGLSGIDKNTEKVILKGMSLKPESRYASAEELIQALAGRAKVQKLRKQLLFTLGSAAAVIVLVLASVKLLTNGKEQSGNTQSVQQLTAANTTVKDAPAAENAKKTEALETTNEPAQTEHLNEETPAEMPSGNKESEQAGREVQVEQPENFTVTQGEDEYYVMEGTEYQICCPFPEEFAIDTAASGSTLLMRANSTVNQNYIEIHGKTLDQPTTGEAALRDAEAELGGHVNYEMFGDGWFACSVDEAGIGVYRKGKLRASGTIVVWFDYHAVDQDEKHSEYIEYMEKRFTSYLQ